jgi:hypothetical protein
LKDNRSTGQKEAYNVLLWQHSDLNLHTCVETDASGKGYLALSHRGKRMSYADGIVEGLEPLVPWLVVIAMQTEIAYVNTSKSIIELLWPYQQGDAFTVNQGAHIIAKG